ncbi:hypothetical protein [Rhodanobacter lindaniclasticus]
MTEEHEEHQATPEHDELKAMLREMVNAPIQQYVEQHLSAIDGYLREAFPALSDGVGSIKSLVTRNARNADKAHEEFAEWAKGAEEEQRSDFRSWVTEVKQRLADGSELAKGHASSMRVAAKRQSRIVALVLALTVVNTLAIGVLLWLVHLPVR